MQQHLGIGVLGDGRAWHRIGGHGPLQRGLPGRVRGGHLAKMPGISSGYEQARLKFRNCFRSAARALT